MSRDRDIDLDRELIMIGLVVDQFNRLEQTITKIIATYIRPKDSRTDFFAKNVMNSSIVSFGSKIKLLLAINKQENLVELDRDKLHRILSIRNAITHNDVATKFKLEIPEDPDEDIYSYIVMDRMKGDGSIETISKDQAFSEFYQLHSALEPKLNQMLEIAKKRFV